MSATTHWVFHERCQAQCRLCSVPGWMLCFEFTVFGIFYTFLVLIVNATEVERGQQKSAREKPSEKPSEEFEHGLQPQRILSPAELSLGQTMLFAKGFVFETLHNNTCPLLAQFYRICTCDLRTRHPCVIVCSLCRCKIQPRSRWLCIQS